MVAQAGLTSGRYDKILHFLPEYKGYPPSCSTDSVHGYGLQNPGRESVLISLLRAPSMGKVFFLVVDAYSQWPEISNDFYINRSNHQCFMSFIFIQSPATTIGIRQWSIIYIK